jgi:hypothetical protein
VSESDTEKRLSPEPNFCELSPLFFGFYGAVNVSIPLDYGSIPTEQPAAISKLLELE